MEAIPLRYYWYSPNLFSLTQHRVILIQIGYLVMCACKGNQFELK